MASSYTDLERNADFAFYFSSPHLGSVAPRLPNTANTAFIQCRQVKLAYSAKWCQRNCYHGHLVFRFIETVVNVWLFQVLLHVK